MIWGWAGVQKWWLWWVGGWVCEKKEDFYKALRIPKKRNKKQSLQLTKRVWCRVCLSWKLELIGCLSQNTPKMKRIYQMQVRSQTFPFLPLYRSISGSLLCHTRWDGAFSSLVVSAWGTCTPFILALLLSSWSVYDRGLNVLFCTTIRKHIKNSKVLPNLGYIYIIYITIAFGFGVNPAE